MPKCITFRANGGNEEAQCSGDDALQGYTVDDGQPPAGAKHVFAYTHGFCGETGNSKGVEATEAAWCSKVAQGCGMSYPSDEWHGEKGANCLIQYVSQHTPDGAHFEIDNCSKYKAGNVKCYQDLLAAMKKNNIGNRRLLLKNLKPEEAQQLRATFASDGKLLSNFVIVEEEFNKKAVQDALNGTCASVAQSVNTHDYKVNENHIAAGGPTSPTQTASASSSGGSTGTR